ncbi:AMP-binding protein, partial [Streptomyces shenzhenensis]|uniref:AMP-binding protein n=1 Tax=Streptomyces shenzhenensis TaxID=943815 RepID=UPI001C68D967
MALDDRATMQELAVQPEGAPETHWLQDELAYVVYTSGSTGRPKGVGVTHGGLASYVVSAAGRLGWGEAGARFALLQAQNTDLGNTVVFGSLVTGGVLHVPNADTAMDAAAMAEYLARH